MVKYSRQRECILKDLQSRRDHPTADMVYESVRDSFPNISLGTVYRNLSLLAENGTILNAVPSKELFGNIFFKNTPLHDGAVIIRDGMILAAACFLPKPQKEELIAKQLGFVPL